MKRIRRAWLLPIGLLLLAGIADSQEPPKLADRLQAPPPKGPPDALRTFVLRDGFRAELVAHEPQVTSPVAAAYDEDGRLYVVEMRDYPDPLKPGEKPIGRVRLLEDRDGDGVYETGTVFADGLAWPTGIACWDGGVFVTAAPDIWYFKDTRGTGVADVRRKEFTGFVVYNVQALVNGLQWGVDNRLYGVTAGNGGEVRPADQPTARPVSVRGRDFRFDPRGMAFEAVSGTAQFGNAFDDWYRRFLCANRLVAGHVVLPSHALARHPALSVPRVVQDCAAEGENVPLPMFQISPAEAWREVRTERYHAEGQKLPPSEMTARGVFTSGTGIVVYRGAAYPDRYRGQVFLGNPAGNLIHRRSLTPKGATFGATRVDEKSEFLASTDNWFRPVNLLNAPDGTLHVLDMYREVVEHPWSIPDDIKAHLDLSSGRDRGRIYRIAPEGFRRPNPPRLSQAGSADLVRHLENPNSWWRETAQRLLYQRQDRDVIPALRAMATGSDSPLARMHALWALDGLKALEDRDILAALGHPAAGLREHGLLLAEPRLARNPELAAAVVKRADDPDARVRFQAAVALGELPAEKRAGALASILRRDAADPWARYAVLASSRDAEFTLLEPLLTDPAFVAAAGGPDAISLLASTIGSRGKAGEPERLLQQVARDGVPEPVRSRVVLALGDGLIRIGKTFQDVPIAASAAEGKLLASLSRSMLGTAGSETAAAAARVRAAAWLVHVPFNDGRAAYAKLLDPAGPPELPLAAVRALRLVPSDEVPGLLLRHWRAYSPAVRAEILTTLTSRTGWAAALLDAVEAGTVAPVDLGTVHQATLRQHRDPGVQDRAGKLLGQATTAARAGVLTAYRPVLEKKGDADRGLAVFKRECATCHYAAGVGTSVGPAIAAVGNRTPDALLTAILDPNREVDPRYLTYSVNTTDGRTLSGIITAETATTVTLRRADGADVVLRSRIDEMRSVGVSLMPEGLERTIPPADMADLLAFLATVR